MEHEREARRGDVGGSGGVDADVSSTWCPESTDTPAPQPPNDTPADVDEIMAPPDSHANGTMETSRPPSSHTSSSSSLRHLIVMAPDGGWGWMVVLASFVCQAIIEGLLCVFGILLPELLEYFQAGRGKTALAGSLMAGMFLMSGPIAGAVVNLYGCRVCTMLGSAITSTGLIISITVPNIDLFILTYGVTSGIGLGLMLVPSLVIVGYYFERRRALATGIACSGAGAGMLTFAYLTHYLMSLYTWQNTVLLLAGIALNGVVMGALMRPLQTLASTVTTSSSSEDDEGCEKEKLVQSVDTDGGTAVVGVVDSGVCVGEHGYDTSSEAGSVGGPQLRDRSATLQHQQPTDAPPNHLVKPSPYLLLNKSIRAEIQEAKLYHQSCHELSSTSDAKNNSDSGGGSTNHIAHIDPAAHRTVKMLTMQGHQLKPPALINSCYELTSDQHSHAHTNHRHRTATHTPATQKRHTHRRRTRSAVLKDLSNPLNRQDIFYSGSIANIPEYQSQADLRSYIASTTNLPSTDHPTRHSSNDHRKCPSSKHTQHRLRAAMCRAIRSLRAMCAPRVLLNPYFMILCLSNMFIQLAYFIPYVFLIDYALQVGVEKDYTATLVSVIGLSNGIGRLAAGWLGNLHGVNPLHVNNISLLVAGATLVLVGFVCKTFPTLLGAVAVFGYSVAAFVSLLTVFLVKYLGLDQLTSSLSFLNLVKGIASFAGPPLAGSILDSTGSYEAVFCMAGSFFILAAALYYMLHVVSYIQQAQKLRHEREQYNAQVKLSAVPTV